MRRDGQRRSFWALLASLVLHALIALFLVLRHEEPAAVSHVAVPIELQFVEAAPEEKVEKKVEAAPKAVAPAKKAPSKKTVAVAPSAPAAPSPQPSPLPGRGSPSPSPSPSPDAPKAITLVPSSDFAVAAGTHGIEPEAPRGHTVVNSEQEHPDPVAMREYTEEKLGRRAGAMVEGVVADTQIRNGLVHPYFTGARAALEGDLSSGDVPLPKDKTPGREALKGFLQNQENYGRTGNPFAAGSEPKWNDLSLARNETSGMAMQARDPNWAAINRQAEQSMAAQVATAGSLDHAIVSAVVELIQEPGGGVADAHVVKSSGYRAFDEYVLHRARKVFLTLDDPPQEGQGISSAGWRTLWRFSYWPASVNEMRGQRVRVELLRVQKGQGSGNPLEHVGP